MHAHTTCYIILSKAQSAVRARGLYARATNRTHTLLKSSIHFSCQHAESTNRVGPAQRARCLAQQLNWRQSNIPQSTCVVCVLMDAHTRTSTRQIDGFFLLLVRRWLHALSRAMCWPYFCLIPAAACRNRAHNFYIIIELSRSVRARIFEPNS